MAGKVLIVVDMLRDFMEKGGALFCGRQAREIIPYVAQTVERMRGEGAAIIFLTDWHAPDDPEFKLFGPHAVRGSRGAEVIEELPVRPGDRLVHKTHFSGFFQTELEDILRALAPEDVYVVGVCTSICVMHTVGDLLDRGYRTHVLAPGVADFDQDQHEFALRHLRTIGAYIESLEAEPPEV
jgi:nicotinamidase/pyrazinamidase